MAYFSCMAGVGGKGNSVIVTCDADFAGIPITCTNGQKTYTKVCPSFSPYEVTFTGLVAGTWTISATVDGVVYSTTAIVTDITAVLSYGFNWQMWVDSSSSLHSEDYNDLSDLLSDEAAIRQLFTEHAPTDYAASTATVTPDLATVLNNDLCAKWINLRDYALDTLYANPLIAAAMDSADKYFYGEWGIVDNTTTPPTWGAKGNIPVMTSNTAPYGTVTRNAVTPTGGGEAYCAFDGNDSTFWRYPSGTGDYIRYKFTNPVCIKELYIKNNGTGTTSLSTQKLKVSNDGVTWISLNDILLNKDGIEVDVNSDNYYLYAEINLSNYVSSDGSIGITTLQFYGRELSVSVPKMATNTTPYGEASANVSSTNAYKAFDNNTNTIWQGTTYNDGRSDSTSQGEILYKFTSPVCIKALYVIGFFDAQGYDVIKNSAIEGSNDGVTFTPIANFEDFNYGRSVYPFFFSNSNSYLYYKYKGTWFLPSGHGESYRPILGDIQFYGLDYSEKEFEEGATKKWLYDHGVELETFTLAKSNNNCVAEKRNSSIYLSKPSNGVEASASVTLDLTPYDLMRGKIGSIFYTDNGNAYMGVINGNTGIAELTLKNNTSLMPNNLGIDISSIDGSYKAVFTTAGGGNATQFDFVEFWLE